MMANDNTDDLQSKDQQQDFDPDATMSYKALGEELPELPASDDFSEDGTARAEKHSENGTANGSGSVNQNDSSSQSNSVSQSGSSEDASASESKALRKGGTGFLAKLNAIKKLSFNDEEGKATASGSDDASNNAPEHLNAKAPVHDESQEPPAKHSDSVTAKARVVNIDSAQTATAKRSTSSKAGSGTAAKRSGGSGGSGGSSSGGGGSRTGSGKGANSGGVTTTTIAGRQVRRSTGGGQRSQAAVRRPTLNTLESSDYIQAQMNDNSYRIRGGSKMKRNKGFIPLAVAAVIALVALAIAGYFAYGFVTNFLAGGEEEEVITLTPEQTRSALDAQMPKILDNISKSPDQAFSEFKDESGWNVVLDDRAIPNNFDGTAAGKQIIHLDPSVTDTEAALKGYYESEFSAYTIDELQTNFNGFWQLSIQSGDAGLYSEVVYINLAASSLDNEIEHFASSQGLNGENSRVEPLFEDNRGTVYQGSITVGEQTYFWQILGCELSAKYKGTDERQLPDTAVYIKCRVATYDFDNIEDSIVGSL